MAVLQLTRLCVSTQERGACYLFFHELRAYLNSCDVPLDVRPIDIEELELEVGWEAKVYVTDSDTYVLGQIQEGVRRLLCDPLADHRPDWQVSIESTPKRLKDDAITDAARPSPWYWVVSVHRET